MFKRRAILLLGLVVSFFLLLSVLPNSPAKGWEVELSRGKQQPTEQSQGTEGAGDPRPKAIDSKTSHPIWYLINDAQRRFDDTLKAQSKTLPQAVAEYRRRYKMAPPPHFDKWFELAQSNNVQLVDEYDTIYDQMTPFWGISPKTIRSRVKEALGFPNSLIGVAIRDHRVHHIDGGEEWQRKATEGMMAKFLAYLPDMDLAFNVHDEPRVMVPHEDLSRLVQKAKTVNMPKSDALRKPINDFSSTAPELNLGRTFEETKTTRFNVFAHQATWTHSKLSCAPNSPARTLDDDERFDDRSSYALSDLGFIYNTSAMTDICLSPSLSSTYGFFDRPNAYNIVHELFPIFSQSKISSYADIVYPSPWYWYEKVAYDELKDRPWVNKKGQLYWRGSTTGGFSRDGGWRRQHRQNFVRKINAVDDAKILVDRGESSSKPDFEVADVPRGEYRNLVDVQFSHVGQCDPGDCDAQKGFFDIKNMVDQQDAWAYKYLLDIDGNAFSGRFYAFLRSYSLIFKQAVFREWHTEWLKPWVHFIPLSMQGDDWLEAVRFFEATSLGSNEGERIAMASREWAKKVVRKEDMEVWFFRLMLEYGRVIDDHREEIGFDPTSADLRLKENTEDAPAALNEVLKEKPAS